MTLPGELEGRGSAKSVEDYDLFREGDIEPHLGKKIQSLIYKQHTLIVYLDPDLNVEWAFTDGYGDLSESAGRIINRATELQAMPTSHLTSEQRHSFRMLVGEAVARILSQRGDTRGADDALEKATTFLQARNWEITRWWYLQAALVSGALVVLAALALWLSRSSVQPVLGQSTFDVFMAAGAGAGGALLSILMGPRTFGNEPYATKRIHLFLGAARILGGTLGAILVALALKAKLITIGSDDSYQLYLLVCMIAGSSERLVPNFIERVELSVGGSPSKPRRST